MGIFPNRKLFHTCYEMGNPSNVEFRSILLTMHNVNVNAHYINNGP